MTPDELLAAALAHESPADLDPLLRALWSDARGDWDAAHKIAQDDDSREAAWIHAYLHRREGDIGNAAYWYHRAGRQEGQGNFEEEWRSIASTLLERASPSRRNRHGSAG
jgi:hypothetical protein